MVDSMISHRSQSGGLQQNSEILAPQGVKTSEFFLFFAFLRLITRRLIAHRKNLTVFHIHAFAQENLDQ